MAGRVADAQENRFILRARFGKRFVAPGKPIDRIVLVLDQVRRLFAGEPVGVGVRLR
jgi:hypothetical protein